MFSLGNLAHSLRTNNCKSLEVPLIIGTCAKIQFAMHDSNNKVMFGFVQYSAKIVGKICSCAVSGFWKFHSLSWALGILTCSYRSRKHDTRSH
jgi:hypothetical protein